MSNPKDYTVGWLCAIGTEQGAAEAFLDEEHMAPSAVAPRDNNTYVLGKMGEHNVVIVGPPYGEYGTSTAATVARDMLHSFPNVRICLMVGIGGGVPSRHDIRLGDVVVGVTKNGQAGVFQYDFGKEIQDQEFQSTRLLDQSPTLLRSAVSRLQVFYRKNGGHRFQETINGILNKNPNLLEEYQRPDPSTDRLYDKKAVHPSKSKESCAIACGDSMLLSREQRAKNKDPVIHYGVIASGNTLMKDALIRDQLALEKDVLCFEMEAAGLMNHFPCLVVRGICDYSDSHKNKDWQGYAAMTAVAYAKDLIGLIHPTTIERENRFANVPSSVAKGLDQPNNGYHDQNKIAILDWLSPLDYSTQLSDHLSIRQEGSGEWLLSSDKFQTWVQKRKHMLFCPGMPGAGKTILTSIVIDRLHAQFQEDSKTSVAYFFFNHKRQDEQTIDVLLASFLRQLVASQSPLPEVVHELYKQYNTTTKQTRPPIKELIRAIKSVVALYSRVFMIIDALDECKSAHYTRWSVLSSVFQLQSETEANFFITSRFDMEIASAFSNIPSLEIRASNEDVRRYLRGNMVYLPRFVQNDPNLQEKIIHSVVQAVQGMFLVAYLHLESLKGKTAPREITTALQNLATGSEAYEQIYTATMERIAEQSKEQSRLATSILSWLTFAWRPMRVIELQHALAVKEGKSKFDKYSMPDTECMASVCAGLVTIDSKSGTIRLLHYTAQEYFQQTFKRWFPEAHSKITMTCITYLSYRIFKLRAGDGRGSIASRVDSHPFYGYASHYWGHHASEGYVQRNELMEFLTDTARMESYFKILKHIQWQENESASSGLKSQTTVLQLAVWFGLTAAIQLLLKKTILLINNNANIDAVNDDDETSLHIAAKNGWKAIVQLLLDKEADTEVVNNYFSTPLHLAVLWGHEDIVRQLLKYDANIEAENLDGETPLHLAAINGGKRIIRQLLKNGANIEALNLDDETPLHRAAEHGNEDTVRQLLDCDANLEAADDDGKTPLHHAAGNGQQHAVQLLLEWRATTNAANTGGLIAPCFADFLTYENYSNPRSENHEISPNSLLEHGANINAVDKNGKTPLHLAVESGHEQIAESLLNKGARINAADLDGKRPVDYALKGYQSGKDRYSRLVQLLLNEDAAIQVTNHWDHTTYEAPKVKNETVELALRLKGAVRAPAMTIEDLDSRTRKKPRLDH
ncbi:hypothetical protein V8C40DRAFT_273247 [Trichoderma camerunense]